MLPTEKDISKALDYLASTDEEEANARASVKALEERKKTIKAVAFLDADGAQGERMEKAYASEEYKLFIEQYENKIADHAFLSNKRKRAELTIEVWRSINANQRRGNV